MDLSEPEPARGTPAALTVAALGAALVNFAVFSLGFGFAGLELRGFLILVFTAVALAQLGLTLAALVRALGKQFNSPVLAVLDTLLLFATILGWLAGAFFLSLTKGVA